MESFERSKTRGAKSVNDDHTRAKIVLCQPPENKSPKSQILPMA